MREIEIRAQRFTETSRAMAFEFLAEQESRGDKRVTFQSIGSLADEACHQTCECCGKSRGIGYIQLNEAGEAICIFCEVIKLFDKKA